MLAPVSESCSYRNMSVSTLVEDGVGGLLGIFVASEAGGTIKVWDNNAASGAVIVNTFSPLAGTFYPIPARFNVGCYVEITGVCDLTAFYTT